MLHFATRSEHQEIGVLIPTPFCTLYTPYKGSISHVALATLSANGLSMLGHLVTDIDLPTLSVFGFMCFFLVFPRSVLQILKKLHAKYLKKTHNVYGQNIAFVQRTKLCFCPPMTASPFFQAASCVDEYEIATK